MERSDTDPSELDRPDGNSLVENYELHDVAQRYVLDRLDDAGFTVQEWGIDKRDDDGKLIYDDKPDLAIYADGTLVGFVEVKSKSSPRYMGRFNERHYDKYLAHAESWGLPVAVVMVQVDADASRSQDAFGTEPSDAVYDEFACIVHPDRGIDPYRSSEHPAVGPFPDGNDAVCIPHDARVGIDTALATLYTHGLTAQTRGEAEDGET